MFDYSLLHWVTFFSAAFLLVISPGPDIIFILGQTLGGGRRTGFAAMFGVQSGALVHALFAALGLSAILAASATIFQVVKWVGAAYLVWLGIQSLRGAGDTFMRETGQPGLPARRVYMQGILVSLLNPKVGIFFLAFLPQFVVEGVAPAWAQMLLHGVLVVAVAVVLEPWLVLAGDRLARTLRSRPRIGLWLERMLGGVLIALGLRLALSER